MMAEDTALGESSRRRAAMRICVACWDEISIRYFQRVPGEIELQARWMKELAECLAFQVEAAQAEIRQGCEMRREAEIRTSALGQPMEGL